MRSLLNLHCARTLCRSAAHLQQSSRPPDQGERSEGWPYRNKPDRHGVYHKRRPTRKEKGSHWQRSAMQEKLSSALTMPPNVNVLHWREWLTSTVHSGSNASSVAPSASPPAGEESKSPQATADDAHASGSKDAGAFPPDAFELTDHGVETVQSDANEGEDEEPQAEVQMRVVLEADSEQRHPLNRKVEARLKLDDLAEEGGLGPEATEFLKRVAGSRYGRNTGLLKLKSERYMHREDNYRHVGEMANSLVQEGRRFAEEIGEPLQDPTIAVAGE